ncbi:hypothetical protein TNCV_1512811 [Trichonephila clavipes]|nr:hypothetical protein TNCV_1512811 [Trichonephila clavipes]
MRICDLGQRREKKKKWFKKPFIGVFLVLQNSKSDVKRNILHCLRYGYLSSLSTIAVVSSVITTFDSGLQPLYVASVGLLRSRGDVNA